MRSSALAIFLVLGLGVISLIGCAKRSSTKATLQSPPSATPIPTFAPITTLFRPVNSDPKSKLPVLVTLHGMWSLPKDFLGDDLQGYANELQAVIVAVSAPNPQNAKQYNWSDNVKENHARIQSALDEHLKTISHRRDRVFLLGYSQGAFASLNLGLAYPDHYAGVIAISPGSLTNSPLPDKSLTLKNHGFVLCYGGKDEPSWIKQGQERMKVAKQRGAKTEIKEYPQEEHLIPGDLDELLPKWFAILLQLADETSAKE